MKEVLNINLLKIPDQSMAGHGLSAGFIKDLPAPGQGFSGFLSEHLSNLQDNIINQNEENVNKKSADSPLSGNEAIFNSNDRLMENQIDLRNEKNLHSSRNEAEGSENYKTIRSSNSNEADAPGRKDKIQKEAKDNINKDNSVRRKNTDDKPEGSNANEITVLLKDIGIILDMLKGLPPDKRIHELKSVLFKLKESMESLNTGAGKNRFIAANGAEIKKLSEQLKSLIKSWNERFEKGNISHNKNNINTIENKRANNTDSIEKKRVENTGSKEAKTESFNLTDLKKQITKLLEEIKQYYNKKPENGISKYDEISNENKNSGSQKLMRESFNAERNEGSQARDNTSNYNFSYFRKETDSIGSLQKSNHPAAGRKNSAFSEQLNDIAQNAKIVVRDSKNGSFSIRLHPESLGRVNVNLNLEQGVIIGKFLVESAEAKEIMLENIHAITDRLKEDGISVGEFHVNVRDENKSYSDNDYNIEKISYNDPLQALAAGMEYETNSLYVHNGEIDLLI